MKESKRQRQVAETIRRNLSYVLQDQGSFIYGSKPMVTVTSVRMTTDLGLARAYLSIYNVEDKNEILTLLQDNVVGIRQGLAHRIRKHVRRIPSLEIYFDDTLDEMYSINGLFNQLKKDGHMPDETSDDSEE